MLPPESLTISKQCGDGGIGSPASQAPRQLAAAPLLESNRVLVRNPLGQNAKGPEWGLLHFGGAANPLRRMLYPPHANSPVSHKICRDIGSPFRSMQ
jgi:hypothetical protein